MSYHKFKDEDGNEYGSFEVFYSPGHPNAQGILSTKGWYWWACFPGCLPDGAPQGPYESEAEALQVAALTERADLAREVYRENEAHGDRSPVER